MCSILHRAVARMQTKFYSLSRGRAVASELYFVCTAAECLKKLRKRRAYCIMNAAQTAFCYVQTNDFLQEVISVLAIFLPIWYS